MPLLPNVDATARGAAQPLLLCFANGGMLGDVFLHILPETLGGNHGSSHNSHSHDHQDHHGHGHSDDHDHSGHGHSIADSAGSHAVLGGFIAFFLVEKVVRRPFARAHPTPSPEPTWGMLPDAYPRPQALQRRQALARRLLAPSCSRAEHGRGTGHGSGACEGWEEGVLTARGAGERGGRLVVR